ncbi:MAG TPA: serine/threonine-protein kinase [Gemmatirosa sp.]
MVDLRDRLQTALGGAYVLDRELGGGGMARVFVARDAALGRDVVVKVLAPALAEALSAERFGREVRLAAQLQEPHIVPVLAAGATADGVPWYTMPYVAGEGLRARLVRQTALGGPVPLGEATSILRDLAKALAYAHGRGIVHRDIKPENVLLSSGTAVVTDFGIAKALARAQTQAPDGPAGARAGLPSGTLTRAGTSLGTPAYMAPEQAAGDPDVDARADLYAWGVIAYELLAGRHPFADRTTPHALVAAHIGEAPRPLGTVAPAVPALLAALVMRCLEKDPARRPASAVELLAVLDDGRATGARAALPRRARGLVSVGGALALLAAAGLAWHARPSVAGAASVAPTMLAVLPFDNAGPAAQGVFTDGLTDAVTAKLGALPGLAVIDRHSAAQYRATTKPARQIGTELGVPYLVEGVVRWAQDAAGAWRAQVTPTLVDARAGTTKWTGESVVITPADPFSAQAEIATQVAEALRVTLRPADRSALARRLTDDPEALAAYMRGRALVNANFDGGWTPAAAAAWAQAAADFTRAVTLDPGFGDAWGMLAMTRFAAANMASEDTAARARLRTTLAQALAHAPDNPTVLLEVAQTRTYIDHDTVGVEALYRRIIAVLPPNAPSASDMASVILDAHGQFDSAYVMLRRAAALDPRSAGRLLEAATAARARRRWADARGYADAVLALDSASEPGWIAQVLVAEAQGDTDAMQRLAAPALARLPHASQQLWHELAAAGGPYGPKYLARSARDLDIGTLADSADYYDAKTDVALRRGDLARARAYGDSLQSLLAGRALAGDNDANVVAILAFAQANRGDTAAARGTLARAFATARVWNPDTVRRVDARVVAGTFARLGEPATAVRWLAADLADPHGDWVAGGWTPRAFAVSPKLLVLHRTPAFERFLRAHPE